MDKVASWGKIYWPIWLVFSLLITFLIPEVYALITNPRNTLSDWVWDRLDVSTQQQLPWTAAHYLVFGCWLTVVSWLTFHFFFRRFT